MVVNWSAAFLTVLPLIGVGVSQPLTSRYIKTWYEVHVKKPSWRPPNWAFPPVWTTLYLLMGYASYLIWRDGGESFGGPACVPLILYATQLILNWAWSIIFFWAHSFKWATYEIIALAINIAACIYTFYPINQTAALLLVPYMAWVSFATALTVTIWGMNSASPTSSKKSS